jgi:hypothetical protein
MAEYRLKPSLSLSVRRVTISFHTPFLESYPNSAMQLFIIKVIRVIARLIFFYGFLTEYFIINKR